MKRPVSRREVVPEGLVTTLPSPGVELGAVQGGKGSRQARGTGSGLTARPTRPEGMFRVAWKRKKAQELFVPGQQRTSQEKRAV